MKSACPACGGIHLDDFFTIPHAPVQSVVTMTSREEARAIPRKPVVLSFCTTCGFIFNRAFDASIDFFTQGYEDQQGFSATFTAFITELAENLIERYDLRQKHVLEIGCGKGDFIRLIAERGGNRGTGIDPAFVPGRSPSADRVEFLNEFYTEKHRGLQADAVVCRHTLEHIHDVRSFLSTLRAAEGTSDAVLFFEVPETVRILEQQAFWDIYYEHCCYFTPGSLARAFRNSGFELLDLYRGYDDQYLFIEARPAAEPEQVSPLEESVESLKGKTIQFADQVNRQLAAWRSRLEAYKAEGKKVVIWGGGSKAAGFLTHFDDLQLIEYVCDINPHFEGNYIPGFGVPYVNPAFLADYRPDLVIVMNSIYLEEIRADLAGMRLHPELEGL